MSSSSKSSRDYSRKHRRDILKPWRQSHNLPPSPPSPPPNRTPPTYPITTNSLSSPSPPHNSTQNQIVYDLSKLHHLLNLIEINLQQAIEATNPSPSTSPRVFPATLDQVNFHSEFWHLIQSLLSQLSSLSSAREEHSHNLPPSPPSPPPNRTPPTSPITINSLSSPLPPYNLTQNQIVHDLNELHHLSNLIDINLQQAIEDTNPSPPTSPRVFPATLDQVNFRSEFCHSFRVNAIRYFDRFNRYPRVAAWRKKKGRFTSEMVFGFFQIPVARIVTRTFKARSDWWISSKAYFDGFIDQVERVPFDLSRHNMYEIPSGVYRQFCDTTKIKLERNKKDVHDIKEEMQKFREEMNARSVRQENTVPMVVGQHYGLSDFSEFRSMQGGPSSFMNMVPGAVRQSLLANLHRILGSYNLFARAPFHIGRQNLQTTIDTQHDVDGIVEQNIPNRGKRQQLPSKYLVTPFTVQAPTTMVPKQRVSKSKNKRKTANLSPLNLGGVFEGYNEEENNVTFLGSQFTGNILFYENVDPAKVRRGNYENHMNSWMEFLIRRRPLNGNWTVAYTSTISVHPENNQFIILNDPHVIGTLDGSTRPLSILE
ncbi:hypothetical protein Tco_0492474 [Tanacetum coccineum]